MTVIESIIDRLKRGPKGDEQWVSRQRYQECTECHGYTTISVLGCHGNKPHCGRTDHRSCGTKSAFCHTCHGTGLGLSGMWALLKPILEPQPLEPLSTPNG